MNFILIGSCTILAAGLLVVSRVSLFVLAEYAELVELVEDFDND